MKQKVENSDRQLQIALFHPYGTFLEETTSGGGTYEASTRELLGVIAGKMNLGVTHFVPGGAKESRRRQAEAAKNDVVFFQVSLFERIFARKPHSLLSRWISRLGLLRTRQTLVSMGMDLAYFSSPSHMALRLDDFPFIFTVWDTGHRDLPEFEEMSSPKEYATRESLYSNAVPRAFHVMVDSETTAHKLEKWYGLGADRWSAIGLLPRVDDVPVSDSPVSGDYIIYPAARWPHKNHITLFKAMKIVRRHHPAIRLVLTGDDAGHGSTLNDKALRLGIADAIDDFGLVSRSQLLGLIRGARVLVMPSLLGPTNIPPLEALGLGTHAVVSDVHHYGTVVDDMIVKVPAMDAEAWARAILECLEKESPTPVNFSSDAAIEAHVAVFESFISSTRT